MQQWSPPSFDPQPLMTEVSSVVEDATAPIQADARPALPATQEMFLRGLQEGLEEGRQQGMALGREEGLKIGQEEGYQAGYRQAYQDGTEKVERLTQSLQTLWDELSQLPTDLAPALRELVYETALRLAARERMDRTVVEQMVQEAISRLPQPPSHLVLRVPQADWEVWQDVLGEGVARYRLDLHADPAVGSGHAFVEFQGVRLDIGAHARQALVRSALGLIDTEHPGEKP